MAITIYIVVVLIATLTTTHVVLTLPQPQLSREELLQVVKFGKLTSITKLLSIFNLCDTTAAADLLQKVASL